MDGVRPSGRVSASAAASADADLARMAERLQAALRREGYTGPFSVGRVVNEARAALRAVLSADFVGPPVEVELVRRFVLETLRHSADVLVVSHAIGGRVHPHDVVEPASLGRLHELVENGLDGEAAPGWLVQLYAQAKAAGHRRLDVGKLTPAVIAGLATSGKPDRFAIALHRLSNHHSVRPLRAESAADIVNAMRMPRVYKAPMSFQMIDQILLDQQRRGIYSADELALLREALAAQERLEAEGRITRWGAPGGPP
jgi:hypothetical protein